MNKSNKDPATYFLRVRPELGKRLRKMASEREMSVGELLEILLEKVLNQKV